MIRISQCCPHAPIGTRIRTLMLEQPLYAQQGKLFTQIGSLPFRDVEKAVEYSLRCDIPFLPELPALGDAMLDYIKRPGSLSCLARFWQHEFQTVKIQCIGPATLMASGYEENDALARIFEHITGITQGLRARETILFLDEPALGYTGVEFQRLWEPIFANFSFIRGVHVCGNMQWDLLLASNIDIISYDASQFDITRYYRDRQGKRIAWGVRQGNEVRDWRPGDLITPPCGLGTKLYTDAASEKTITDLVEIAGHYRANVGLSGPS